MAVKGKGKQVAGKAPASSASFSGKRKSTRADGESSGALPKKKCSGVSRFVDDVAADADFEGGEEEEEEDDFEWEMDEDFDFELPDIGAKEVKNGTKGPGKSSPLPFFIKEEELNDDELEEAIKERYRGSGFVSFDEDVKECDESLSVAHATKDLSFWRVKCMVGRERQTAFCLMQKFVDLLKIGKQLQIFSVFALDHVKGFAYVEADKACNVFEACNGLCILYPSRIELVPRNEVPNLLSIQKKACGISKGMWVRMKNGKYKGDLAEVVLVNDTKKRVTIKLVPRIDLQAIAKKFGGGTSLKAAAIPAPRLISSHELEDFRPHIEVRRDRETGEIFEVLDGLMLKDGYLYKKVSMGSLIHWGVQPSSVELTKFEDLCMDQVKDVSWLSSIYKTKMKKTLPETSHQTNGEKSNLKNGGKSNQKNGEKSNHKDGEKSNQMDGDKQRNDFDIDDFVLFGKKDCGIIIDKENDTFKVLKGDVNGSEVVTINIRVIKKNCVDKVFTATDRCKKTISIDDVVKVFEGPLEGREGIVRHMYRGVLFIYDECQSENNGFFCAKSEICDLVKKSRDFGGGKSGSNVGPSFAQSPIRSSMEDDNSQSFSRNGQSNARGTFSVGQTLRICKGPLKGYLCRVIRIYRADVTVKLDSLGKLLTVDEKLLSFSNSKRDDTTAMQCDIFGSEEGQSAGGGLGMDNFEFNAGMSSFGRDSWNTPSCSNTSFSRDNDNKDQNQVADPWGSKPSSGNGDQDHGAANSWGKAPSSSAEQSPWNKIESGEKGSDANCKNDADAWNKASTKGETSTGGWQVDTPIQKTDQTWSTKDQNQAPDPWGSKPSSRNGDQDHGAANSWGKAPSSIAEQSPWNKIESGEKGSDANCKNDADAWNKASTKGETSAGGWQIDAPIQKTDQTWSTKGASSVWDGAVAVVESDAGGWNKAGLSTAGSGDGRASGEDGWNGTKSKPHTVSSTETSGWEQAKLPSSDGGGSWNSQGADADGTKETTGKDRAEGFGGQMGNWVSPNSGGADNSWGIKGKGVLESKDDSWSNKSAASKETKPADKNPWQSSFNNSVQTKAWKTTSVDEKAAPTHIESEKSEAGSTEAGGSKKSTHGTQAAGWAAAASSFEDESQQPNSWSKVKSPPSSSGWEKSAATVAETVGGWKSTAPSFEHESQTSSWDKASASPSFTQWQTSKPADATAKEGWKKDGFSGEGQTDRWNKEKSSDGDQASGWNTAGNGGGSKDAWTNSRDEAKASEGGDFGQESRGQWKSGGDCRNNESGKSWGQGGNSWNQQRDFDGGRGSGRGGRYGGRGGRNRDNFENPDGADGGGRFGRGGGRGRNGGGGYNRDNSDTREFGRGRGQGRGRGPGRGRGQDQGNGRERFGSYSNKPSSSWGSAEVTDWGKSRDQHSAGASWNGGSSFDRDNKPSWGNDWSKTAKPNEEDEAADGQGGWSGEKVGQASRPSSEAVNNWGKWKEPCSDDTAAKPGGSNGWGGEESAGDRSSDWSNGGGNKWGHGSDFGRGGGGRRDNSFSRGRGFGRNSSGRHFCSWNSGDSSSKEDNEESKTGGGWSKGHGASEAGKSSWNSGGNAEKGSWGASEAGKSSWNSGGNAEKGSWGASEAGKSTCNSGGNAEKGSWGGWKSEGEIQPASADGSTNLNSGRQSTGWENGDGNKWNKETGSQDRSEGWSRQSDFGGGGGRGRGGSFSGGGRSAGRGSGGRGFGKEGNDGWQASNSNSSWNSGGNAERSSRGGWKMEGEDEPARRESEGGKGSWDQAEGPKW